MGFALTNDAGIADFQARVPAGPALAGASFFGQWVLSDPSINPTFALATSDGLRFTIGTDLSASRCKRACCEERSHPRAF